MKNKLFRFSFIMLLVSLIIGGCSKNGGQKSSDDKNRIVVGQSWVIDSTDPLDGPNGWSLTNHGITEYVYTLQADGTLESRFISEMEMVDEHNFVATLNEGVKFSDGSEVDAQALADGLNLVMEKNEFALASAGLIEFTPVEDYKLEIKTELPTVNIESILAEWTNVVFKEDNGDYIFTGAYVVEDLKPGAEVLLKRNEHYEGYEERAEHILVKAFADNNALKLAYESGEVDLAFGLSNQVARELEEKGYDAYDYSAGYQYYGFLNLERDHLTNENFRKALDLAINREDLITAIGGGKVPTGLFASNFSFNGNDQLVYNQDQAKELLEKEGYSYKDDKLVDANNQPVKISILTYSSRPDLPLVGQAIVSDLEKMGISAEINLADSIDEEASKKDFDLLLYAQNATATGDPHFFFAQHFKTGEVKNYMGYSNPKVDELIDELGVTSDLSKRDEISKEIQSIIHAEVPILYTVDPHWYVMLSEKISDYTLWNGDYFVINPTLKIN